MSRTLPLLPGWDGGGGFPGGGGLFGTTAVVVGLVADADALAAMLALGAAEAVAVAVLDAGNGGCVMAWMLDACGGGSFGFVATSFFEVTATTIPAPASSATRGRA